MDLGNFGLATSTLILKKNNAWDQVQTSILEMNEALLR